MPTLAGNKHPSLHFFPHGRRPFPSFDKKKYGPIRRKWTSKWLFPRRHIEQKHKQKIKGISIQGMNTITQSKNKLKYGKMSFII